MRLYKHSPEARREARDHLVTVLGLYAEACANELEWDQGVSFALLVAQRRKLTADELEVLAYVTGERSTWIARRIRADRMLAEAQDIYERAHVKWVVTEGGEVA